MTRLMIPVTLMAKTITARPLCPTGMWSACTTWHPATQLFIKTIAGLTSISHDTIKMEQLVSPSKFL